MPPTAEAPWDLPDWEQHEVFDVDWSQTIGRRRDRDNQGLGDGWLDVDMGGIKPEEFGSEGYGDPSPFAAGGEMPSSSETSRRRSPCAWYQPLHFYGPDWGIFIQADCIHRVANDIGHWLYPGTRLTPRLTTELHRAAFLTFYLHEAFHHKTEALALRFEITRLTSQYWEYWDQVYLPAKRSGVGCLEEALANVDSFIRLGHEPYRSALSKDVHEATRNYLYWRFHHDPPGYNDAPKYMASPMHEEGLSELKAQVMDAHTSPAAHSVHRGWEAAPNMHESLFGINSHIFQIVPKTGRPRVPVRTPGPIRPTSGTPLRRHP